MVAIEHCQNTTTAAGIATTSVRVSLQHSSTAYNQLDTIVLSPTSSATSTASTTTTSSIPTAQHTDERAIRPPTSPTRVANVKHETQQQLHAKHLFAVKSKMSVSPDEPIAESKTQAKPAISHSSVDMKMENQSNPEALTAQQLSKKVLKLDLTGKDVPEFALKSPKSPISARLPHQVSLTSSVDVEDRKTLREALYQGIFHRHRKTIFAMGSFLRMLRSRNSQYNTIRSSSEGEDIDEVR